MTAKNKQPIFIGVAWPYANGSLHLGHVASFMPADFLARYYRLNGHKVLMVSGSDCHGTPIEVKAEQGKTTPQKIVERYDREFNRTLLKGLDFSYDLFTKTANPFHYKQVQELFLDLLKKGYIYKKTQSLPYCDKCQRFLPDRYIEGKCPQCDFPEARGDQCDNCGSILDAKELISPRCKICGRKPIWKDSVHFFLKLSAFEKKLLDWANKSRGWRPNARNFTLKFLESGLSDRAITRDSDWGIPVPVKGYEGKTIYVWFEAVSGYLTASQEYSKKTGEPDYWKDFWQNKKAVHYYVHGKDNIPFHTIIWPAILLGLGNLNLPNLIVSSEYLTFSGKQFSKSRNWGVWLPEFLEKWDPETLRYYLGINGPENSDADFSWKEYQTKINTELIGKFGNFINRVLFFTKNNFKGTIPKLKNPDKSDKKNLENCEKLFGEVGKLIEAAKFQAALKKIVKFSEDCNRYIDAKEPWKTLKTDEQR
ncbi:MAG: methionine--tRNA ligase, partial [Candidatus Moranbacteria bacterium]|nr:methionine--tRNA ligase [Candidatus Moranbacteria bacterium]